MPRPLLIAELASNHGGDSRSLFAGGDRALDAGADLIKAQWYDPRDLRRTDPQYDWLIESALTLEDLEACRSRWGRQFFVSVFSPPPQDAEWPLFTPVKIGAADAMRAPLREAWISRGLELWLSIGPVCDVPAADLGKWCDLLFHTVSVYPCPVEFAGLGRLIRWRSAFKDLAIGYSDHTVGLEASMAALGLGVHALEVHLQWPDAKRFAGPWEKSLANLNTLRVERDRLLRLWYPGGEYQGRWGVP